MLKKHQQLRIHDLLNNGLTVKEIASRTGFSVGTIYKYRHLGGQLQGRTKSDYGQIPSELKPYQTLIDTYLKKRKTKSRDLLFTIQQAGYNGRNEVANAYFKVRRLQLQPVPALKHVETDMGQQAQVDWGHFGQMTINGKVEKIYLFAYILSWSRATYLEFVVRQNQRTLQTCHIHAFEKLGIPKEIVYDNMKTVVIHHRRIAGKEDDVRFNLDFLDFARYYQFNVVACPTYWPRTKGKVEATIKYVRGSFPRLTPKQQTNLSELNQRLSIWVSEYAHERIHGSTHQKPAQRWNEEKDYLRFPHNLPSYVSSPLRSYKASQYGIIQIAGTTYNLGSSYALMQVEIREIQNYGLPFIEIYRQNQLAMTLHVPTQKHAWVSVPEALPDTSSASNATLLVTQSQNEKKSLKYDIPVEARNLDHYSVLMKQQGGNHG